MIIDEEQKFGVSVKEKLRQLKVNVDTLTMTATPIPRTLQFSLMGARDLSVIQTPPPNRYPIQTEVHTFNEEIIADAVNFEMSRNGQVFFVNNRISNLFELKAMIERHIPDCRVCIGHGQMEPAELEKIIFDFVNYDYDVLLATTIIEVASTYPMPIPLSSTRRRTSASVTCTRCADVWGGAIKSFLLPAGTAFVLPYSRSKTTPASHRELLRPGQWHPHCHAGP